MARGVDLSEIYAVFENGYNNRNLDALMALFEPGATMVRLDGTQATGLDAIRESLEVLLAANGRMTMRPRYVVESGDLALLSCAWTLKVGDESMSSVTAEVVRRQPDGGWRYVLDHPFAGVDAADHVPPAGASQQS
jgi:uncharacterized protein (TIGR02246 family)